MTQYLFLIYGDESGLADMTPQAWDEMLRAHEAWQASVPETGAQVVGGAPLQPSATATSVRRGGGGAPLVTDGPFVETKEALGGYYLLECPDLDVALGLARTLPVEGVEVRPVMPVGP